MKLALIITVLIVLFTAHDVYGAYRKISAWIDYLKGIK